MGSDKPPLWLRCTVGVLVAIITAAFRWQFLGVLELRSPFLTFFPAVAIAALYGGFSAGFLATVVAAALAVYFWIEPVGSFAISDFADLITMVVFIASSALVSYLAEATFRARARVHKAEEQSSLAAEREKAEEERRNLNRILRALSNAIQATIHAEDESTLLDAVCRIIVEDCGHPMVWMGFAEDDEDKTVRPVAHAGFEEGYLETIKITWSDTESGSGPTGTAIRTGTPDVCRNMLTESRMRPWREQAMKRGYASSVAVPLSVDGRMLGALTIYSKQPESFPDDEVKLLAELAGDLAYGITALRLRHAHRQSEKELGESRARLDLALRSAAMGAWHWDIIENRLYFDNQACNLLGIDPATFTGADKEFFNAVHPDDRETIRTAHARIIEKDEPYETEYRAVWPDGSIHYITTRGKLIQDGEGESSRLNGIIWDITERKQMEEELRRSRDELDLRVRKRTAELELSNEKLRLVPSRLIQVQENERKRLASDLHDSIGQTLAALKFRIEYVKTALGKSELQESAKLLDEFIPVLQRSIDETRAIYMGLKPTILTDYGILATLEWHRQQLLSLYPDPHIELEIAIREEDIPEDLKISIFRIAQEALNNTIKHGKAEWVDLRLAINNGTIELEISDDGIGMDLDYILESHTAKSLGLIGMRERTELGGGEFSINSTPNGGTTVKAVWPSQRGYPPGGEIYY